MLAWVRPEKFPHMTMLPSTRELLEQHAADHPLPADGPTVPAGTARAEAPSGTVLNVRGDGHVGHAKAPLLPGRVRSEGVSHVQLSLRGPPSPATGVWDVRGVTAEANGFSALVPACPEAWVREETWMIKV